MDIRKLTAKQRASLLREVFGSAQGQAALEILKDLFDGPSYTKGDPHHTAYLEGAREVIQYLKDATEKGTVYEADET